MDNIAERIVALQKNARPISEEILDLKASGFSIIDSIKIIRSGYSMPLAEAKQLVSSHPSWTSIVGANEALHDELEKLFLSEGCTEFHRLGGFFAFPFFPAKFNIGDFQIVWKEWLFFHLLEVKRNGLQYIKTNADSKIIKDGKDVGYLLYLENTRKEGQRVQCVIQEKNFTAVCEIKEKGGKEELYLFRCSVNHEGIGEFRWKRRHLDGISGSFQKKMAEYVWFMGICLMCIWKDDSDFGKLP